MMARTAFLWVLPVICAGAITALSVPVVAAGNKACELLTLSELEAVLGTKVTLNSDGAVTGGKTAHCTGQAPAAAVMLRLVTGLEAGRDRTGSKEKKGLEMFKQQGVKVDVKTFGPITCSTVVPPENLAQLGFNTTCTVTKETAVAGIEVLVKNQKDIIPIEKLHPLAEKMAGRF